MLQSAYKESNKLKTQLCRYTALFMITAIGAYILFIVFGRSFLADGSGNFDGIAQHIPIYAEIKRNFAKFLAGEGYEFWSWDIGLGDDNFIAFNNRFLNPITYFIIAFPKEHLDIGYTLAGVISQWLSGFMFILFGRKLTFNESQLVMGGLCYAFSGWIIFAIIRQVTFLVATILFPLLILGIEKVLRGESPLLFVFSVALHIMYSTQWAYIAGVIAVVYFPVRYFTAYYDKTKIENDLKTFFKKMFSYWGYGFVGILISSVILVTSVIKMTGATTKSTVENEILYSLSEYLLFPKCFFQATSTTGIYSVLGLPVVCVILYPFIIKSIKKKSTAAIMSAGLFLFSLLPFSGRFFNGFSYSVGRWFYVLVFFMVWMSMELYKPETFENKKNIRSMIIWISGLFVWDIVICYFALDIMTKTGAITITIGVLLSYILIWLLGCKKALSGKKMYGLAICAVVSASIIGYTNCMLLPGLGEAIYKSAPIGKAALNAEISTQRVGVDLQEYDTDFYRIDSVDGYSDKRVARVKANENIYFGIRTINEYLSTIDSSWHLFNKTVGNNAGYFDRTTSFSNDNREGLDFLMGVKYFLGDSDNKRAGASEYAPYGYSNYKKIEDVSVLKNKYFMGIGSSYDKYITEAEFLEYSPLEREQILLQAIVVSDEDANSGKLKGIKHANKTELKTDVQEIPASINNLKNVSLKGDENGGTLTVKYYDEENYGHFSLSIPKVENARVVIAFENFVRRENNLDTALRLQDKTLSGNVLSKFIKRKSYDDDERFDIEVSKGDIEKAAQFRKGKNQGFDDVTDYYINLGYFENIEGDIDIGINNEGIYDFDSIKVYVVPMDIYDESASILEKNSLQIESFGDDIIKGTMEADVASVMYFSILNQKGWDIYVDGKKVNKLENVNISFTGAKISAGVHEIELRYSTPYLKLSLTMSIIGVLVAICLEVIYRRKRYAGK